MYAALIPVAIGAVVATVRKASFSWDSLWIAGGSSAAFSGVAVLAKSVMTNKPGRELGHGVKSPTMGHKARRDELA